MIRILITDDHPVVRLGLIKILEEASDIVVSGEAGSGSELMNCLHQNEYDVILLDISLPGRNGLDLLKEIKIMKPNIPVLILSIHPEEQYALRALKLGAAGYLTKSSVPGELVAAVRRLALGKKYITMNLAERITPDTGSAKPLHYNLSNRELEVLCMLAEGNSPHDIASKLSLSVKTISTYRSRILIKMNFKNTSEIIRYALVEGLVS
jgi:two-component system invasion response regulator UvrY